MHYTRYKQHIIDSWLNEENAKQQHLYDNCEHRRPPEYSSNDEALQAISQAAENAERQAVLDSRSKQGLTIKEAVDIIIKHIALVVVPDESDYSKNLAVYDYDRKIYTYSDDLLSEYLVEILGITSQTMMSSLIKTLIAKRRKMALYNPLPSYKVAVGNGIYNFITGELEEATPYYTITTKIQTPYIKGYPCPEYKDGFSFEKMVDDFANGNKDRRQLLLQMCKSIISGHHSSASLFVILGKGGDGKSTFFNMLTNVVGRPNVAHVNFSEITQPDKMLETLNKKMMLGLDNDVNLYIKHTALLKSMASHETITLSRKYMNAISVEFTPVIVQLCNEMPRFAETKDSMRRRIISFKAENSYYANNSQNPEVEKYIKDPNFLKHVLAYILEEETCPFYSDYNEVDRGVTDETLDSEDMMSQFVDDMINVGFVAETNTYLPLKLLYAAYIDWSHSNNPGGKPYAMRSFKSKLTDILYDLGYSFDPHGKQYRISVLEDENLFSTQTLNEIKEGREVEDALNSQNQVKCFVRDHAARRTFKSAKRQSHEVSPIEYFNLKSSIQDFIIANDIDYDSAIENYEIDNEQTTNDDDNDVRELAEHDLLRSVQNKEVDHIASYKSKVLNLSQSEDRLHRRQSLSDLSSEIQQVAFTLRDTMLIGLIQDLTTSSDIDVITETLLDSIDRIVECLQE